MIRCTSLVLALALAACGSDSPKKTPDAAATPDAPTMVATVSCTGITPAATITIDSLGDAYMPATATITQGQTVMFMSTSIHDMTPGHLPADSAIADPGIHVDFNKTECKIFTATGTYGFHCSIHGFNGTITVQ